MRVIVFQAITPDSPAAFVARIRCAIPGRVEKKSAAVEDWHPVYFHAQTAADAEARATEWWDAEVAKERQRAENAQARVAARQAVKAVQP